MIRLPLPVSTSDLARHVNHPVLLALLLAALALSACQAQPAAPTVALNTPAAVDAQTAPPTAAPTSTPLPPEPIVASVNLGSAPQTIDPTLLGPLDSSGQDIAASVFARLARLNQDTGRVEPVLAERWEQLEDGRTWRVYLRPDAAWVRLDAATGEVQRVRAVTAGDVVAAVHRACDPATGAPLGTRPGLFLIQGCEDVYLSDPATLPEGEVERLVSVRVLNDTALEFRLRTRSALFPTLLATPQLTPIPADLVAEAGEAWTQPGTALTSGPFTLQASEGEGYTLVANPQWPLPRGGNVDVVQVAFGEDGALGAWQAGGLDLVVIPGGEVAGLDFENDPAYRQLALPAAEFLVVQYDHAPVNDVRVRQAFALALDRQAIIDEVLEPAGLTAIPASDITPPGMALSPGDTGLAADLDTARALFADAGFRDCAFMPPFVMFTTASSSPLNRALAETYVAQWNEAFGCGDRIAIEERPLMDVVAMLDELPDEGYRIPRPGLIAFGWQADYPDTHHWLADLVGCREQFPNAYFGQGRACGEVDETLGRAATEHDDAARAALYEDANRALFGPQGEMPVIPVLTYTRPIAVSPWLEIGPQQAGPLHFEEWVVDPAGQP